LVILHGQLFKYFQQSIGIMKVVSTQSSQVLAGRIASNLNLQIIDTRWKKFPDGELYLRATDTAEDILVVGSTLTSDDLVELLLLKDTFLKSDITLVLPYMGYARQDKQFNPGEPLSARAIAKVLGMGVNRVITVNIHEKTVLDYFQTDTIDLSLCSSAGEFIEKLPVTNPLILSPDSGALNLAREVASVGCNEYDHLEKTRISGEIVKIEPKNCNVKNRDVVIMDDIISTGGTQAIAASMLMEQGARSIHTVGVHGVLSEGAYNRLISTGISSVSFSDTIERACSVYTAAQEISDSINKIWHG